MKEASYQHLPGGGETPTQNEVKIKEGRNDEEEAGGDELKEDDKE